MKSAKWLIVSAAAATIALSVYVVIARLTDLTTGWVRDSCVIRASAAKYVQRTSPNKAAVRWEAGPFSTP